MCSFQREQIQAESLCTSLAIFVLALCDARSLTYSAPACREAGSDGQECSSIGPTSGNVKIGVDDDSKDAEVGGGDCPRLGRGRNAHGLWWWRRYRHHGR